MSFDTDDIICRKCMNDFNSPEHKAKCGPAIGEPGSRVTGWRDTTPLPSLDRDLTEARSMFRVLADWDITYDDSTEYVNQCTTHPTEKRATIYTCDADSRSYFLHEVLHIAIKAARRLGKEGEELLVQDLVTAFRKAGDTG